MGVPHNKKRIFMVGGTGTIGRATVQALVAQGHDIVCFVRPGADIAALSGVTIRFGNVACAESVAHDGFYNESFDVLVSCLASRTGVPDDAWAIDHRAQINVLNAGQTAGAGHIILLSAICVQKPVLAFQHAKLATEAAITASGLRYSIVRPTAFFKSLSGQISRVQGGKSFLLFGNGTLTACKPISDDDVAHYLVQCIDDPARHNRILPIGGPGDAVTPRAQGEMLFAMLGRKPAFKSVPVWVMNAVIAVLSLAGRVSKKAQQASELARIGRYYATESMLVWNAQTAAYDATVTPSFGTQTLADHYRAVIAGRVANDRGDHTVF